jgi:DNA-binding LacI/PurR family transcriptional regulator
MRDDGGGPVEPGGNEPRSRGQRLEDVAARAGVSRATVSRVVNGGARVAESTRLAVEAAIEELGYTPNRAARSLAGRHSDTVALVVSEPSARLFADPFIAATIRGAAVGLARSRYQLVLLMIQDEADHSRVERHLLWGDTDGVLLLSARSDDGLPAMLAEAGIACVLAGRPPTDAPGVGFVDADNVGGARQAVAHLLAAGRRTVASVAGPADMAPGVDRRAGWAKALVDGGYEAHDDLVVVTEFTREAGAEATRELLARRPDLDAIFAASDLQAVGALDALRQSGRRVPDDVAVVGFDDSDLARSADPPLTTVRQPLEELGTAMVELLLAQLDEDAEPHGVVLATELVVRQSA